MRRETVPIDMSSEQKTMLGIISTRQLIYLISGGATLYAVIPPVFTFFPNFIVGFMACLLVAVPILVIVVVFGFMKKGKYHLNMDQYIIIKLNIRSQWGIWRKGKYAKDWMVRK